MNSKFDISISAFDRNLPGEQQVVQEMEVKNALLWSTESPNLYKAVVEVHSLTWRLLKYGVVVPSADTMNDYTIANGTVMGVENGDNHCIEDYEAMHHSVFNERCLVYVGSCRSRRGNQPHGYGKWIGVSVGYHPHQRIA